MTPLVVALVSFPIAFVAGLLLGKAYLRATLVNGTVSRDRHHKLLKIQRQKYRERVLILHNRIRDQLKLEAGKIATLTTQVSRLQENLVARDQQISDLNTDLQDARFKAKNLAEKLDGWKQRVTPLAEKLREQHTLIRQLQEDKTSPSETGDSTDNLQKIAQMSDKELAKVAAKLAISPTLAARDRWIEQACELHQHDAPPARRAS